MIKAIVNAKIVTSEEILDGYTLIFNKKIISIQIEVPFNIETIDAKGAYLSAGFIDIHIHGSNGADVMDATYSSLETISNSLIKTGVTSFLATTMTMSKDRILEALLNIKKYRDSVTGAKILGVHLEGPFINPSKSGAQNPKYILKPNIKFIEEYLDIIKLITLAPEVEGAREFILYLKKNYPHILLSIGHSSSNYKQTKESFKWGISHATHLFNAMNPLHHREPNIIGAVLEDDNISCDIIADTIHIHPSLFKILFKLKDDKLILITDAMRAGCLYDGEYSLGGQRVFVKDGEARLKNGTLAGSVLKLNSALKNFKNYSNISLPKLISMVTSTPAKRLNLNLGELKEGYPADMVLFDSNFNIIKTFIGGSLVVNYH